MANFDFFNALNGNPAVAEVKALEDALSVHTLIKSCATEVLKHLWLPQEDEIILVTGPTGVGKSTLVKLLIAELAKQPSEPGDVPVISLTAQNGSSFVTRWKTLLVNIMERINPLLFEAGKVTNPSVHRPSMFGHQFDKVPIPQLQGRVTEGLQARRTRVVIVDEGQHLSPRGSGFEENSMMAEHLKALGSNSKTILVLIGSYGLLTYLDVSAQLDRRCSAIHFRRYNNEAADIATFEKILRSFSNKAPELLPVQDLLNERQLLMAGSVGCTGNLRNWLVKAMKEAIFCNSKCVTTDILMRTSKKKKSLNRMDGEIRAGEAQFEELDAPIAGFVKAYPEEESVKTVFSGGSENSKPAKHLKPGNRHPTRDLVAVCEGLAGGNQPFVGRQ